MLQLERSCEGEGFPSRYDTFSCLSSPPSSRASWSCCFPVHAQVRQAGGEGRLVKVFCGSTQLHNSLGGDGPLSLFLEQNTFFL